ncbi:MAG: peptide deformylase [Flavobacteriales bacterium]|uniref:peptide deformylase n=1 Tax=Candidatus Ulvibacter alkanivorans TaxID=2267620 RepID=UPI000DF2FA99|nr:peptide deformylase [Candidatus Ulvibacter alkanivorans]MCH2490926.1 peptide deformylase [Flavobacteriales bacterium]
MIVPIVAYGDPVLRKVAKDIDENYPKLDALIENMFDTMYGARGIGLAAPQIGLPIRIFIVDATPFEDDEDLSEEEQKLVAEFKKVFINAKIISEEGDEWAFNEGCLSIPDINEDVFRQPKITIEYYDADFKKHTETYEGIVARIIQHEYDHIEGILFTDKLSSLKKRLIKGKLSNISKGKIDVKYRMKFPLAKKKR